MSVTSFAEEICWSGEEKKPSGKEVVFRVTSIGKIQGYRVDFEMRAGYDLWWDPEDEMLIAVLQTYAEWIRWDEYIFYKKPDHSAIEIIDPSDDKVVGSIKVRRRVGGDPSGEIDMTNVVCFKTAVSRREAPVGGEVGQ